MFGRSRALAAVAAALVALGLAVPGASASTSGRPTAVAAPTATAGTTSAYSYLKAHNRGFDKNWYNYSIVTALIGNEISRDNAGVFAATLNHGEIPATLFVPNDRAFQMLLTQVTGHTYTTEASVLWHLGLLHMADVENLMDYQLVKGRTLPSSAVLGANGKNLATYYDGRTVHVAVYKFAAGPVISLWDNDRRLRNPRVILSQVDLNKGNRQVIHGIDRVLVGFREQMAPDWFIGGTPSWLGAMGLVCSNELSETCVPQSTPGHG